MADISAFPKGSFPVNTWPMLTWPMAFIVIPFEFAEYWDGRVVMNRVVNLSVVMNRVVNQSDYSELEAL